MSKAIGMIEFKTTATGITAADAMVKTSEVEIVEAQTVCPGKYIAIITGDLSAVKAAVDAAVTTYEDKCIDSFVPVSYTHLPAYTADHAGSSYRSWMRSDR